MVSRLAVSNFSFARVAQWIECFPPKELRLSYQTISYRLKSLHFLVFSQFADTIRYELKRFVSYTIVSNLHKLQIFPLTMKRKIFNKLFRNCSGAIPALCSSPRKDPRSLSVVD